MTGTTIWRPRRDIEERAPIKAGTFDTGSGAIRLTGEAKDPDGKVLQYVIEGKAEGKSMSGTYQIGEHKGEFTFTRM